MLTFVVPFTMQLIKLNGFSNATFFHGFEFIIVINFNLLLPIEFDHISFIWEVIFVCNKKAFRFLKVRVIYGLDQESTFRNVTISSSKRPQPLHLGTATQIG